MYDLHCCSFLCVGLCSHSPKYAVVVFFNVVLSIEFLECLWFLWSFYWMLPSYFKEYTSVVTIINKALLFSILVFPQSSQFLGIICVLYRFASEFLLNDRVTLIFHNYLYISVKFYDHINNACVVLLLVQGFRLGTILFISTFLFLSSGLLVRWVVSVICFPRTVCSQSAWCPEMISPCSFPWMTSKKILGSWGGKFSDHELFPQELSYLALKSLVLNM